MAEILPQAKFYISTTDPSTIGTCKAEVAFVGRSNVGKSSLLNALCRQKQLAKVSNTPGRTRAINIFSTGRSIWVVDLPGYGFAVGPSEEKESWRRMIEGYLTNRAASLKAVFVIVDALVGPTKLDLQMVEWLHSISVPYCIIANKIDKVSVPQHRHRRAEIAAQLGCQPQDIAWVSSTKGTGIDSLRKDVEQILRSSD